MTMEGTRTFWMFLLINHLPFCPTEAQNFTTPMYSSTAALGTSFTTVEQNHDHDTDTNNTRADCLIDSEMGIIAVSTAGGLIVCLLVTTAVLAWQVWQLQQRALIPRSSRSNMDLVDSAGYWGDDRPEAQGLIGPCDTSVMLEEVKADSKENGEEEEKSCVEIQDEVTSRQEEGATAMLFDPEDKGDQMQSSRDCMEVPRDLEDMPLVV